MLRENKQTKREDSIAFLFLKFKNKLIRGDTNENNIYLLEGLMTTSGHHLH